MATEVKLSKWKLTPCKRAEGSPAQEAVGLKFVDLFTAARGSHHEPYLQMVRDAWQGKFKAGSQADTEQGKKGTAQG